MNDRSCVSMEVRIADEPAAHLPALIAALREFFSTIDDLPKSVWATSTGGRAGRTRAFSWEALEKLAVSEETLDVSSIELRSRPLEDRPGAVSFEMGLRLRYQPPVKIERVEPALLWLAMEARSKGFEAMPAASVAFIERCAEHMPVLHGGITRLSNIVEASCEATGIGMDLKKQSALFQQRRAHDWPFRNFARTVCRRLYWTTLLGPALAQAAGGAEAARAAGALDVREVNGALIFRAMDGPPRDSLDPEFLAATTRLRRWLWPHTFQNPLDAAGFEADVGLPAADAAPL